MPYKNVPAELTGKMDSCVEQVMAQGKDKESAISICYASLVEGQAMPEGVVFEPGLVSMAGRKPALREYVEAEISPRGEKTGREWDVTIVGPATPDDLLVVDGREYIRSKNGRLYACEALKSSTPLWEGIKVFDNHLTDAEFEEKAGMRSVASEWIGVLTAPRWDEQARKLCSTLKIVDHSLAEKLRLAWEQGVLNAVGLSMDTSPTSRDVVIEGRSWPAVEGFQKIYSVDLVSEPAAGGGFNRLIAAKHTQEVTMLSDEMRNEIMALIKEALAAMSKPEPEPAVEEANPAAPAQSPDLVAQVKVLEAQQMVDRKLAAAKLSEDAAQLVREQLAGRAVEAAEVDRLIEGVRKVAAVRDGSGDVRNAGTTARIEVGMDKDERAEVEFLRLAAGNNTFRIIEASDKPLVRDRFTPAITSWVKAGRPYYGTRKLSEWVYQYLDGDPFSDGRAYEALTTGNMSSIVKNALNVMLANAYSVREEWWAPIVTEEEVDTIDAATLVRTYGVSTLSTVNEGNAYTELNWRDDEETASFVKKGNYVAITLETLLNDKLNVVRSIPTLLANSWYNTLSGLVSSVFTCNTATGAVLADTGALFNATAVTTAGGHANLLTAALSYAAFDAIALAMMKQSDQYAGGGTDGGRRLMIEPKHLLIPVDLRGTAYQLENSEEVPGSGNWNPNQYRGAFKTIIVPDWTDANNWAAVGDKVRFPAIWLIFLRGKKVPELVTSEQEQQGAMFTNDELRYKVRMMTWQFSSTYTCAPVSDWRPLHKSNV
jgi:hypothetical protein